jgi:ribosome biogenesis GTPase A
MSIQWYPGHMAKAKREIEKVLPKIHVIYEVLDARCPIASQNPMIQSVTNKKPRIILLNKSDIADPTTTSAWETYFSSKKDTKALITNAQLGKGMEPLLKATKDLVYDKYKHKTFKSINVMVVGIPNVGKSALINRLTKRKVTKVANRPAVTQRQQWVALDKDITLLDSPGILWPKFEEETVGFTLAACGTIKSTIFNHEDVVFFALKHIVENYPSALKTFYKLSSLNESLVELVHDICHKRGFILKGNEMDYDRFYKQFLNDVKNGGFGRISLENPKN